MPSRKIECSETLSEDMHRAVFDYSSSALAVAEEDGTICLANACYAKDVGYSREEIEGRMNWRTFVPPEDLKEMEGFDQDRRVAPDTAPIQHECKIQRKDGTTGNALIRVERIPGTKRIVFSGMDITELKRMEEALGEKERRFRGAFEASAIGMALVGLDGRWLEVNQSVCDIFGYPEQELLAKTFQDLTHPDDLEEDLEDVRRLIDDQIPYYRMEKRYYHRDGYIVWGALSVSLVRDAWGCPLYFVSQVEDITEKKLCEEKLQAALITDELTGLLNRRGFFEHAQERLNLAFKKQEASTLFVLKLDDMKRANDTLGQNQGDAIIREVGDTLRETFQSKGVVGRTGGVEFAVLSDSAGETEAAELERSVAVNRPIPMTIKTAQCPPGEHLVLGQLFARVNAA